MARKEIKNKLVSQEDTRPKIQDIIPRKDRQESLLAKIMGPRLSVSAPSLAKRSAEFRNTRDIAGTFLPLLRGMNKKPEKVIRLKKNISPERIFARLENRDFRAEANAEASAEASAEKKLMRGFGHIFGKPIFWGAARWLFNVFAAAKRVFSHIFRFSFRFALVLVFVCAAGIIILLSSVFARATVSLKPSVATLSLDGIRIEAGTEISGIDDSGKKIPAFLVEATGSLKREFISSARERVSRKTSGTVRIYNGFSSAPQAFVSRTRLHDSSGRVFYLKQRVTVPGAKIENGRIAPRFISAAVEAEKAGEEFNIGPTRFSIPGFAGTPKFNGFYAESSEPFTGGFDGETSVVSQADINAASEEVTAALFAQLQEALEQKIPSGATEIHGAREIAITALRKPKSGEARDRFVVEADGMASVMLFRMDDLLVLLGQLALSPDAEKKISREKSHLEFDRVSLSLKNRLLSFEVRGMFAIVSTVAINEFERLLAGRTRADAENMLRLDSRIRAFGIKLFPFWRRTVPSDNEKILILIQE